jgi:Replication initiator protein A
MEATDNVTSRPSPKPLRLLGRDEMNLAEFPITLLTDRVPKDQREAVYQDEIFDERTGLVLTRKLTVSGGNHGLTTPCDDEVILSLIQLTKQKNNFTNRKVDFTRHELVQLLGWSVGGASYDRILLSLKRWTSVFLQYENAWRDNRTKTWTSVGFHIIDKYELTDTRVGGEQFDLTPSFIIWGEDIFESFQAGYLKPLDYDLCMGLGNSTAKRMYRFLDKRFHHKGDWAFDLREFAHEHIGLGRHYEGPAHLKRNLMPAIDELERIGFLEPLGQADRFQKDGRDWKIRLIQKRNVVEALATEEAKPSIPPSLIAELVNRAVHKSTAAELTQRSPGEFIEAKLEVFDWLMKKKDARVRKSPAGYLVKSITDDYSAPKGFLSKAEIRQQKQATQAGEQQTNASRRQRQEEADRADRERQAIADYRASLTPEERSKIEAIALDLADDETRQIYHKVNVARLRKTMLAKIADDYIRRSIAARETVSA